MRIPATVQLSRFVAGVVFALLVVTCSRPVEHGTTLEGSATADAGGVLQAAPAFARVDRNGTDTVTLADVASQVVPAVVNVSATRVTREFQARPFFHEPLLRDFFRPFPAPRARPQQSLGSGVIVADDGIIVTNNHVVEHAKEVRVTLHDGRELEAEIIGRDPKSDVAVLRLQGKLGDLHSLPLGNSDDLRLGDVVLAVGNPFGVGQTVTMGIVSALGRDNVDIADYEDFIQTDAAINPGNSGGALVNMRGELVGINTAILSRSGGYQGIGFAIPSNMAKPVVDSLVEHGKVVRGWLGVTIQTLDDELADGLGIDVERGVLVSDVADDSPAAKAGVRRGDVIVAVNGHKMTSSGKLRNAVAAAGPGANVRLDIRRGDEAISLDVTLGNLEDTTASERIEADDGPLAGATLRDVDAELRRRFDLPNELRRGVVVAGVEPESAARRAGLRPGDVIVELNRNSVSSVAEFERAYDRAEGTLLLLVRRGATTIYLAIRK